MSIDRFLPQARRLPLLIPPPSPLSFCSLRYSLRWPFRSSLATILYFASPPPLHPPSPCPYLYPTFPCPLSFRRTSSFSPFCLLFLFLLVSLSVFASCDRTTQPNNRHRRLKPENSAASSLLPSHSTRQSSFSIPSPSHPPQLEFCY